MKLGCRIVGSGSRALALERQPSLRDLPPKDLLPHSSAHFTRSLRAIHTNITHRHERR
jgi:hypothetical protein